MSFFGRHKLTTLGLFIFGLFIMGQSGAYAATFTVTSTSDSGLGSFRQAITDANLLSGADTIDFNIAGAGPQTITTTGYLPAITGETHIDGTTQAGTICGDNMDLRVIINGYSQVEFGPTATNSSIKGIAFPDEQIAGNASLYISSDDASVTCSIFGSADGLTAGDSGRIELTSTAQNVTIGGPADTDRNIISGVPHLMSVNLGGGSTSTIENNYFGLQKDGTTRLGEYSLYVTVGGGASTTIKDNIFSNSLANPSVYSGSIFVQGAAVLTGNYAGTDKSKTIDLGGVSDFINAGGPTLLGGSNVSDKNYIYNYNQVVSGSSFGSILGNELIDNGAINSVSRTPMIVGASESGGNTDYVVQLDGNFADSTDYRIELFSNSAATNSKNGLDANNLLSSTVVSKTVAGAQNFTVSAAGTGHTFETVTATEVNVSSPVGYSVTSNLGTLAATTDLQIETDDGVDVVAGSTTGHQTTQTITNLGDSTVDQIGFDLEQTGCYSITSVGTSGTATNTGSSTTEHIFGLES